MQFLTGILFGSLILGEGMLGVLFLAPFVLIAICIIGWGAYEAVIWFDISQASYQSTAWYAWPWHWPGAYLATEYCSLLFTQSEPSSVNILGLISGWFGKWAQTVIAISINVVILCLPIIILNNLFRLFAWVLNWQSPTDV